MNTTLTMHLKCIRKTLSLVESGKIPLLAETRDYPEKFTKIIILLELALRYLHEADSVQSLSVRPESSNDAYAFSPHEQEKQLIERVTAYIHGHLKETLPAAGEIAAFFLTNQRKLKAGFQNAHGMGMHRFHAKERMAAVHAAILRDPYEMLYNVASDYGFDNYHSFYDSFKREFKYTPGSLRKSARKR